MDHKKADIYSGRYFKVSLALVLSVFVAKLIFNGSVTTELGDAIIVALLSLASLVTVCISFYYNRCETCEKIMFGKLSQKQCKGCQKNQS